MVAGIAGGAIGQARLASYDDDLTFIPAAARRALDVLALRQQVIALETHMRYEINLNFALIPQPLVLVVAPQHYLNAACGLVTTAITRTYSKGCIMQPACHPCDMLVIFLHL